MGEVDWPVLHNIGLRVRDVGFRGAICSLFKFLFLVAWGARLTHILNQSTLHYRGVLVLVGVCAGSLRQLPLARQTVALMSLYCYMFRQCERATYVGDIGQLGSYEGG